MLTDYALSAANLFFAISTYNSMNSRNRVTGLLLLQGFVAQAVSGFAGGTFHGFALQLETSTRQLFWNVVVFSVGATLGFLGSAIHAADVQRENGKWLVGAVVIAVAGLGVQLTGFRAHRDFNHNDIFHMIQIVAMSMFFRGSRRLLDRAYSPR